MKEYVILEDETRLFEDTLRTGSLNRAERLISILQNQGHQPVLYTRNVSEWEKTDLELEKNKEQGK